jgi:hypothetical protein
VTGLPVHRHPLPTAACSATPRWSSPAAPSRLIVSLTRFVGAPPADAFDRILEVDAAGQRRHPPRPDRRRGASASCRRRTSRTASPRTSGPRTTRAVRPATTPRESSATRRAPAPVVESQVFAWNPERARGQERGHDPHHGRRPAGRHRRRGLARPRGRRAAAAGATAVRLSGVARLRGGSGGGCADLAGVGRAGDRHLSGTGRSGPSCTRRRPLP